MLALSLSAVCAFIVRHRGAVVRSYTVPCGCFGRRSTVWVCQELHRLIEKGRWSAEPRAALLLAGHGVAACSPRSQNDGRGL